MSQYGPPGGPYPGQPQDPRSVPPAQPYREPADPWGTGQSEDWGGAPASTPPHATGSPAGYRGAGDGPGYGTPAYGTPAYGTPAYGTPAYGTPAYDAAASSRRGAGAPGYGGPGATGSGYGGGPGYGTPEYAGAGQSGYGALAGATAPGWSAQAGPTPGNPASPGISTDDTPPGVVPPGAPGVGRPPRDEPGRPLIALVLTLVVLVCGGLTTAYVLLGKAERATQTPSGARGAQPGVTPPTRPPTGQASTPAPEASSDARFVAAGQCVRNEGSDRDPRMSIAACGPKTYQVLQRFDGPTNGEGDAQSKCSKVGGYTNWYFFNSELDALDFVLCLKRR